MGTGLGHGVGLGDQHGGMGNTWGHGAEHGGMRRSWDRTSRVE